MATLNITNRYENQQKRFAEAVVVTLPSILEEGGQRLSTPAVKAQYADNYVASVIEDDTLVQKAYVIVDEAFPAGTTVTVKAGSGAGEVTLVNAGAGATKGVVVSAVEDSYFEKGAPVTITLGGGAGDVNSGKLRVVLATVSPNINNGNYAAFA